MCTAPLVASVLHMLLNCKHDRQQRSRRSVVILKTVRPRVTLTAIVTAIVLRLCSLASAGTYLPKKYSLQTAVATVATRSKVVVHTLTPIPLDFTPMWSPNAGVYCQKNHTLVRTLLHVSPVHVVRNNESSALRLPLLVFSPSYPQPIFLIVYTITKPPHPSQPHRYDIYDEAHSSEAGLAGSALWLRGQYLRCPPKKSEPLQSRDWRCTFGGHW